MRDSTAWFSSKDYTCGNAAPHGHCRESVRVPQSPVAGPPSACSGPARKQLTWLIHNVSLIVTLFKKDKGKFLYSPKRFTFYSHRIQEKVQVKLIQLITSVIKRKMSFSVAVQTWNLLPVSAK